MTQTSRPDQPHRESEPMTPETAPPPTPEGDGARTSSHRVLGVIAPARWTGVYALIMIIVVFSVWEPSTFPRVDTVWQVLNTNAIAMLAAMALVVPLAAGTFDISVPYTMSLSGAVAAYALVYSHYSLAGAIVLAMGASLLVGVFNAILVVYFRIESLVATLASGFVVSAATLWRTDNQLITGPELSGRFNELAFNTPVSKLTLPVVYALVVAALIGFLLQRTPTGRRLYAVGFNLDAARLAGIRTDRLRVGALLCSSLLAGATGIVLAASVASGSTTNGTPYLLPAFAGVFLGATQIRPGRFNAWGTVLAVVLLGTLTTGFSLADVSQWMQQLVAGVVLVVALMVAGRGAMRTGLGRRRKQTASNDRPSRTVEALP